MQRTWMTRIGIVTLALAIVALSGSAHAEKKEKSAKTLEIGAEVPDFKLSDCCGKEHTLSSLKGKVVVLSFTSQTCPWSKGHDPDADALAKEYAGKDVVFIHIDSAKDNTAESIHEYKEENKLEIPVLKDVNNAFADQVGAKQTPEVFVVDKEGKLAYHGAYDNRKEPTAKGSENYVKAAVDALLDGKPVQTAQVKAWGCGIKRAS